MNVLLSYCISRGCPGVRHIDLHLRGLARLDACLAELQVFKLEAGVAEAVAEWIQRLARDIPLTRSESGLVFGLMREIVVVVDRRSASGLGPAYRQFSAGVHIAEQNVRDRVPAFGSGKPTLQDGRNVR